MPPRLVLLAWLPIATLAGCAVAFPIPGRGFEGASVRLEPPPLDSANAIRAARAAQARFELTRYGHLPWTWRPAAQRCDEIVGRFCLSFSDEPSDWSPPEEPEAIASARDRLLTWLAAAQRADTGDPWIVGQRVRYLLEGGLADEAARIAAGCAAGRAWCLALEGYVLHARADFAGAEAAFDAALAAMPEDERREWTDVSVLLDPADRRTYRRLAGAERDAFERRYWHLADPFYSQPGNARRSEHFVRHVLIRLNEDARTPDRTRWGSDLSELMLRYGGAAGWERIRQTSPAASMERPSVVTRFQPHGRQFLPGADDVLDTAGLRGDPLAREPRAPRSEYAVPFAERLHVLEPQVALFRRDERALVVAAWEFPADSVSDTTRVEAALVLDGESGMVTTRGSLLGPRGVLAASSPSRKLLLSLEALAGGEERAGRARFSVRAPWPERPAVALSDLLLLDGAVDVPATLDGALSHARPSTQVRSGSRLGVYWEVYAADSTAVQSFVSLSLVRGRMPWTRRLAERLRLRDGTDAIRLQWEERQAGSTVPRGVVLDLTRLEPGRYTLELTVAPVGRPSATAVRELVVVR
ncbi:MAG TPA: hypothetical protein VMM18_00705 [Gemmatimonadaceae bacterium]|nr:hypothetical protein [Gemmatimonadaceae bacterium]